MAGYATGNGCFDRLWTGVFDSVRPQGRQAEFRTWTVGAQVAAGPDLGGIRRFADPGQYVDQRSAIVEFLRHGEAFRTAEETTVVAFVTDLEPDMATPLPGCAGNGSVVCLKDELSNLADRGWVFAVVGFESPFSGKRYFPDFRDDGSVNTNAFVELGGRRVPVYVLVASRTRTIAFDFAARLASEVERACGDAKARLVRLTHLAGPVGEIEWEEPLRQATSHRDRGAGNLVSTGEVALRIKQIDEGRVVLKVYEDDLPVRFELPVAAEFSESSEALPPMEWEYRLVHGVEPPDLASAVEVRADLKPRGLGGHGGTQGTIALTLARSFLKSAGKTPRPAVDLTILATPHKRGDPWEFWSYRDPADMLHELKTFRTAEVLGALVEKSVEKAEQGFRTAGLRLEFTDR